MSSVDHALRNDQSESRCDFSADPDREAPRQRSAHALQKLTALGEMTAGLSHELRNILAVINSAINLAERDSGDRAKVGAALVAARGGIQRGLRLTTRLLGFGKPTDQEVHAEDLNALLLGLKPFLVFGAGPGTSLKLELGSGLPNCAVDASRFGTAILNLVVNARDAMPDGGEVRIKTDLVRFLETEETAPNATCVLVRVIDHGQGMPAEVRDRIFDNYFTTKGDIGTGLGVPQVAAFMRASGGCMNVMSEAGAGTSIDLYFPACGSPSLIGTNLWRQLDRWANEGGRHLSPPPRFGH
jgi:signal transduction histidine kinase